MGCHVYAFATDDRRYIKIGFTGHVESRAREIAREHLHGPIRILWHTKGTRDLERELHARFSHLRIPRIFNQTEWFEATPELVEYFAGLPGACDERIVCRVYQRTRDTWARKRAAALEARLTAHDSIVQPVTETATTARALSAEQLPRVPAVPRTEQHAWLTYLGVVP